MENNGASLTTQCLAFCQVLASQEQAFTFTLTIGSTFTFSLDTKEKKKKLPTPSMEKRNLRRRKEFLEGKRLRNFQCDQCDHTFKTGEDLEVHTVKTHESEDPPTTVVKPAPKPVDNKTHKIIEERDAKMNTEPVEIKCKYCNYKTVESAMGTHVEKIHKFRCLKCNYSPVVHSQDRLDYHMRLAHGENKGSSALVAGPESKATDVC
jgi:hypothetical protein